MKRFLPPTLFVLGLLVLYARAMLGEFIRLDDPEYTFFNPFVQNGFSWGNLATAFGDLSHGGIWMPITYLSYMLDISFWGPGPVGHHFVNALVHVFNGLLVWRLAHVVMPAPTAQRSDVNDSSLAGPFLAALIWAVHPLNVEAVGWIAGRKELLWTAFALVALLALLRGSKRWLFVAYVSCAFACMSKPTAMCFPIIAFLFDHRVGWFRRHFPFWVMAMVTGGIAVYSQSHATGYAPVSLYAIPWFLRAWSAFCACGMYIARTIVPYGIRLDYSGGGWEYMVGPTTFCIFLVLAYIARKRNHIDWRWLSLFVIVLPTLGLFGKFGEQAYADRFWYAALIGGAIIIAHYLRKWVTLSIFLVMGLAFLTWQQIGTWKNDYTLFSRVLKYEPTNGRALCHVASERCARFNDLEGGITFYRQSLAVRPRFDTRAQLAYALARRGMIGDATEIYTLGAEVVRDVSIDRKGMMLEALGRAAIELGRDRDAVRFLTASIRAPARFYPDNEARALLSEIKSVIKGNVKK